MKPRFPIFPIVLLALLVPSSAWAGCADVVTAGSWFEQMLARGAFFAALAAFVAGLAVSLTPCVYPMIAITVSIFGANQAKSRWQAAGLSGVFVLGIAVLFTVLGMVAALGGGIFGAALSNKWVVGFVAIVFLALAASMFGAFELALPASLNNRLASVGGLGFRGAFILGLVSALVAAPCTGPALTGILLWIAATHRIALGTLVMFTFALGLGAPFFVVGTFAVSLPKGGSWMLGVKWVFGVVLAVVALYFLRNAVPAMQRLAQPGTAYVVVAAALIAVGVALAAVHVAAEKRGAKHPEWSKPFKLASILPAIAGAFMVISWFLLPKAELQWVSSEAEGRQLAAREGRPVIVDFGATWCGACNELNAHTFSDAAVRAEAGRFVAIRVDATDDEDPQVTAVKDKYHVVGLPTVVLMAHEGQECLRFNEFVPPDRFLKAIESVN